MCRMSKWDCWDREHYLLLHSNNTPSAGSNVKLINFVQFSFCPHKTFNIVDLSNRRKSPRTIAASLINIKHQYYLNNVTPDITILTMYNSQISVLTFITMYSRYQIYYHFNDKLPDLVLRFVEKKNVFVGSPHILSIIKLTHKQNGPMKEIKIL